MKKVTIIQYKWAGSWGPFSIKVSCGECGVNESIVKDVLQKNFSDELVTFTIKEWLPNWWRVILKGGWHAPITLVNGRVLSQGIVLDRNLLISTINEALDPDNEPTGNVIFYQDNCEHCARAKALLDTKNIEYKKYDIIADPLQCRRMFTVAKRHIGNATPITTPQIWLDGVYIGGADALEKHFS